MTEPVDPAEVAARLRVVLAAVAAGEIEARPEELAYITGAADAFDRVSRDQSTETPLPNTFI